jgi:hypothetical protein
MRPCIYGKRALQIEIEFSEQHISAQNSWPWRTLHGDAPIVATPALGFMSTLGGRAPGTVEVLRIADEIAAFAKQVGRLLKCRIGVQRQLFHDINNLDGHQFWGTGGREFKSPRSDQ